MVADSSNSKDLSYDYLRDHNNCLVCMRVFPAVHARLDRSVPGVIPYSAVQVRVVGLTCLNGGSHCWPAVYPDWEVMKTRYTGKNIVVELWVHVEITYESKPGVLWELDGKPTTTTKFAPQLRAYYNHDGTLSSIEDWDLPYFDTSTLKSWLQWCQQSHGAKCTNIPLSNGVCHHNHSLHSSER